MTQPAICLTNSRFYRSRYTGKERDAESGNDYFVARYYDSRTGTFCSADPVAGSPGDPQSWNRYPYGRNDPIDVTDPSGKSWWSKLLIDVGVGVAAYFLLPEMLAYNAAVDASEAAAAAGTVAGAGTAAGVGTVGTAGDVGGMAGTAGTASIETTAPSISFSLGAGGMPSGIALSTTTTVNVTAGAGPSIWAATGNALPFLGTIQMNAWYHPPSKTPWYKNPCITGALGSGALNIGVDAIGLIPEGAGAARLYGNWRGYRGIVADQVGAKIVGQIRNVKAGATGGGLGNALADADWGSISLTAVGFIPGLGQASAGASIVLDAIKTGRKIAKCH
jgi:RHS repeat-associated protein